MATKTKPATAQGAVSAVEERDVLIGRIRACLSVWSGEHGGEVNGALDGLQHSLRDLVNIEPTLADEDALVSFATTGEIASGLERIRMELEQFAEWLAAADRAFKRVAASAVPS